MLFPDVLRNQTRLHILRLRSNHLQHVPDWIGELSLLEELYLQDNLIENLPSSTMKLLWLRVLDVSANRPLRCLPNRRPTLNALTELIIEGSAVKRFPEV